MGFDDFTKQDAGNVTLKIQDPGSLMWKMCHENLVVTVLDEKRNLRCCQLWWKEIE